MKTVLLIVFITVTSVICMADSPLVSALCGPTPQKKDIFDKKITWGKTDFHIHAIRNGSATWITVTSMQNGSQDEVKMTVLGNVADVAVADLNGDKYPELYIYMKPENDTGNSPLIAYSVDKENTLTEITLPPLKNLAEGYRGHDSFMIDKNRLIRRFPIYKAEENATVPTGEMYQLVYRLVPGKRSWRLELIKSSVVK